jgi:hypothetical protein
MTTESPVACAPNYSSSGRRRRTQLAWFWTVVAVVGLTVIYITQPAQHLRALIFIPASGAAVAWLQVRRNTCVSRARHGLFERDDYSTVPQSPADANASRKVAATVVRDGILIGVAAALAAAIL